MKLPKKSILIVTFLIALVLAYFVTSAIMADPDLTNVKAEYTGSTTEFLDTIKENSKDWTDNQKVISLTGVITMKEKKGVWLDDSAYFEFPEGVSIDDLAEGQKVAIKGIAKEYDAALKEIKLKYAVVVKQ